MDHLHNTNNSRPVLSPSWPDCALNAALVFWCFLLQIQFEADQINSIPHPDQNIICLELAVSLLILADELRLG